MNQEEIDNALTDLRNALYGLPFVVVDRSGTAKGAFFDIHHVGVDGEPEPALGFVAEGFQLGGWFGGYFHTPGISSRKETMRGALVWLLNMYIDTVIGG